MSKYEALQAMGIQNPGDISHYALFMVNNTDILRIVYKRKKGSILPVSRSYKFPRLKKSTLVDSGTRQTQVVFESSQEFRNAVKELDDLLDTKYTADQARALIATEVQQLEEDVAARISYIKSLVEKV